MISFLKKAVVRLVLLTTASLNKQSIKEPKFKN